MAYDHYEWMRRIFRRLLESRFLSRSEDEISTLGIILWWELRRIAYNAIILVTGMLCIAAIVCQQEWVADAGHQLYIEDVRPVAFGVILFALGANVCYTFGWTTELFIRWVWRYETRRFAEVAFPLGLLVSILVTISPTAILLVALTVF